MITMSTGLAGLAAVVSLVGGLYAWRASKQVVPLKPTEMALCCRDIRDRDTGAIGIPSALFGVVRFHGDQLFDSFNFAVGEDDVRNLDRRAG